MFSSAPRSACCSFCSGTADVGRFRHYFTAQNVDFFFYSCVCLVVLQQFCVYDVVGYSKFVRCPSKVVFFPPEIIPVLYCDVCIRRRFWEKSQQHYSIGFEGSNRHQCCVIFFFFAGQARNPHLEIHRSHRGNRKPPGPTFKVQQHSVAKRGCRPQTLRFRAATYRRDLFARHLFQR